MMKVVLFCEQKYAISILEPIQKTALDRNYQVLWYIDSSRIQEFNACNARANWTSSIQEIYNFSPEVIFVPCNIVPYYLPGVKIQIFHGYAAEKKDHWVIRKYFDIYMTQGPFFTKKFERLAKIHKSFEVVETGWPRQDWIFENIRAFDPNKEKLLKQHGKGKIALYAPTFSPSLTSLPHIKNALKKLVENRSDVLLILKFHPLTKQEWVEEYKQLAKENEAILWIEDNNVTQYLFMADVMISDTSSVVYEYLLLDKPVITLNNVAQDIYWKNITNAEDLTFAYDEVMDSDEYNTKRKWIIDNYDPYLDGKVSERMLDAAKEYISRNGVPIFKKVNIWRKYTSIKKFGKIHT
jgi:CDP-glycerol glycerophosphotransferase (TagB/SpsB family)